MIMKDEIFDIFVSLGLIKVNKLKVLSKYLVYVMNSNYYFHYIQEVKAGEGTHAAKYNLGDVNNSPIVIYDLNIQKQIVDYLDSKCAEIDFAIVDKKKQLETLEVYKKSLIYEYVTGKKRVSVVS